MKKIYKAFKCIASKHFLYTDANGIRSLFEAVLFEGSRIGALFECRLRVSTSRSRLK